MALLQQITKYQLKFKIPKAPYTSTVLCKFHIHFSEIEYFVVVVADHTSYLVHNVPQDCLG